MSKAVDRTGQTVAGKIVLGRAEAGYEKSPKWNWRCLNCGHEGSPAAWGNLKGLERKNSIYCSNCRVAWRLTMLIKGYKCNNLEVTGPCRLSDRTPKKTSQREVPCRCTICGTEGWWSKNNVQSGEANCKCQQHCQQGRSRTREGIMWTRAKKRAKDAGVPFSIATDDIIIPTHCPVLGIRLKHADASEQARKGMGGFHDASPTLDKFIPELGYVPGNIAVISWRANKIKSDATASEISALSEWMKKGPAA